MCVVIGVAALFCGLSNTANATIKIRELFDNISGHQPGDGGDGTIDGMTNDDTSVGLSTGFWTNSPTGSGAIVYKSSWTVNWVLQNFNGSVLPCSKDDTANGGNGYNGCLDQNAGNLVALSVDTYSPTIYATHPLDSGSYVDFTVAATNYFSFRCSTYYSWATSGDTACGFGLSTGKEATDHFIGFGITRTGTTDALGNNIGNTDYLTQGTLGQAGITGAYAQPDTGGPYLPLATGVSQSWHSGPGTMNYADGGFIVGRLVTSATGASELDVRIIYPYEDVNDVLLDPESTPGYWEATYSFNETSTMNTLLIFIHGNMCEFDAIRMGTQWRDVIGLETIGAPEASPAVTNYAGTAVTLYEPAQVNSATTPMTYQWLSNGVPLLDPTALTSTLSLTPTAVNFTADYSLEVNNYWGTITSAVTHVVFLPTTPAFFTSKPAPITRYAGAPSALFACSADGTPPYTYQWKKNGSNYGSPTTTSSTTNVLIVPGPLSSGDAADYSVTLSNGYGSPTNSEDPALTVITPAAGTYAAEVTALNPWGYWPLNDVTSANAAIWDEWGGNNGQEIDVASALYQVPAVPYVGFPNPHLGLGIQTYNPYTCKMNLPKFVWTNQMTVAYWVNNGAAQLCNMNGYGNGYGMTINAGDLIVQWACFGQPSGGGGWDTGLVVPTTDWTFVAYVVEPDRIIAYVGNAAGYLQSASSYDTFGAEDVETSDANGDTLPNLYPIGFGRESWPFDEDGGGNPWGTMNSTWSDVAIFNYTLSATSVTNLYLAGVGQGVYAAPDGLGNLILNWYPGFTLQSANNSVFGPYSTVGGSPVPPYSVALPTTGSKYYRAR